MKTKVYKRRRARFCAAVVRYFRKGRRPRERAALAAAWRALYHATRRRPDLSSAGGDRKMLLLCWAGGHV